MTTSIDPKLQQVLSKKRAEFRRKGLQLDNAAGFDRLKDAVILGDEVKKNSCFGAVVTGILFLATVVGVLS
jgi:hypothetical protein